MQETFHLPYILDDIPDIPYIPDDRDIYLEINYTLESSNRSGNVTGLIEKPVNNWWALIALLLVLGTAAGNVLVCLAIYLERRLQNVTNYFLMSLAITDLLVAILVMPLGILTLLRGKTSFVIYISILFINVY